MGYLQVEGCLVFCKMLKGHGNSEPKKTNDILIYKEESLHLMSFFLILFHFHLMFITSIFFTQKMLFGDESSTN